MCKILSTFNFNPVRHSILKTSSIQTTDIFFIKYLLCSQTPAKLSIPSFTMAAKTVLSSHKPQTLVIWLGWAGPTDRCNRPNLLQDTEPKKLCRPLLVLNTKVRYRPRKNGRCALMVVLRYRFTLLYIFLSSCTSFSDLFFFIEGEVKPCKESLILSLIVGWLEINIELGAEIVHSSWSPLKFVPIVFSPPGCCRWFQLVLGFQKRY